MKKNLYIPEEIEVGKYYSVDSTVLKLIKRTGKIIESYPNIFSNVYIFECITTHNDVIKKINQNIFLILIARVFLFWIKKM